MLDIVKNMSVKHSFIASVFIGLILGSNPAVTLAETKKILVLENESVELTDEMLVKMYVVNNSDAPIVFIHINKINGELKTKNERLADVIPVTLTLLDDSAGSKESEIAAGHTKQLLYRVDLPLNLTGLYSLSLKDELSNSVLMLIEEKQLAVAGDVTLSETSVSNTNDQNFSISDTENDNPDNFLSNFAGNEPIYFIYGGGQSDAKFQLSFKYRLIGERGTIAQYAPWASGVHLGYTQTAFWDLSSESSPFSDTVFKPSLFYEKHFENVDFILADAHASISSGFEHESNGRGGLDSKSLNVIYVEPSITYPVFGDLKLDLKLRALAYVGDLSDNPDIRDFRGNGSLSIGVGDPNALMFKTEMRGNIGTGKGNLVFNLSYPLDKLFYNNLDLYLFGQLYTGYGESLINYNRRDTRLRFGVALHR